MSQPDSTSTNDAAPPFLAPGDILDRARERAPWLRGQSDAIEAARRLPPPVFDALRKIGTLRIAMPSAWGGPEMSPMEQIELIEILSHADASVGWCASILSDSGYYGGFFDDAAARQLFSALDVGVAGMVFPVGRATEVAGGHRVEGRWRFGSGCLHADWIVGGAMILRNGEPIPEEGGIPQWRVFVFPPDSVEIHDTWHTTGLAGSGSNDYEVRELFVPADRSFSLREIHREEALYRYHGLFFANVPGVPLGIARRAIDELRVIAEKKRAPGSGKPLTHDSRTQAALAEAEGHLGSARSYCVDVMGTLWESLQRGDTPNLEMRARLALMVLHTARGARRTVDLVCEAAGADALYRSCPLERLRRDMIAVGSHIVHQPKSYTTIGRALLGLDPGLAYF